MITVFTPAYNRAYIIGKLYNSLLIQTNKDFEWLIVDDGSDDETESLVKAFIREKKIIIRYFKKQNGGKHTAINLGVQKAKGDLFFIVDSDDYLLKNAIESIFVKYKEIEFYDDIAGVSFRRGYNKTQVIGSPIFFNECVLTIYDFRYKKKIKGDQAEVYKTNILKKYPFPEFKNERFCPESLVWNRIGDRYKVLWTSKIIYVCNYLEDGLTSNIVKLRVSSPIASMLFYSELEKKNIPFLQKVKANINFWRFSYNSSLSSLEKVKKVNIVLSVFTFLLGFLMYIKDKKKVYENIANNK